MENREREERRYREEVEEQRRRRERETEERRKEEERERRVGSEIDYGVEDNPPRPGSSKSQARSINGDSSSAKGSSHVKRQVTSPTARNAKSSVKKTAPGPTLVDRAGAVITNLRKLLDSMAAGFKTNPLVLLRMLAFVVGLLMVFARRDVREKIKRTLGQGWLKVRQTAGMGVKVSYI